MIFRIYKHFEALHADLKDNHKIITRLERRGIEFEEKVDELYQYVEKRCWENLQHTEWRTDNAEFQLTELGDGVREVEKEISGIEL